MRTKTVISAAALVALASAGANAQHSSIVPVLTQLTDSRVVKMEQEDSAFSSMEHIGLKLEFDLEPGSGLQLAGFVEDGLEIRATDNTGADLTDIPDGFMGTKDYIDEVHDWTDEGDMRLSGIALKLASPSRDARDFTIDASMPAHVFSGTEEVEIRVTDSASPVAAHVLGEGVTVKAEIQGTSTNVMFSPGTVRPVLEDIVLLDGRQVVENSGSMWNDASITYFFEGIENATPVIRLTVRRGFREIPIRITVVDQPLP